MNLIYLRTEAVSGYISPLSIQTRYGLAGFTVRKPVACQAGGCQDGTVGDSLTAQARVLYVRRWNTVPS